jgi:hypothetical protein
MGGKVVLGFLFYLQQGVRGGWQRSCDIYLGTSEQTESGASCLTKHQNMFQVMSSGIATVFSPPSAGPEGIVVSAFCVWKRGASSSIHQERIPPSTQYFCVASFLGTGRKKGRQNSTTMDGAKVGFSRQAGGCLYLVIFDTPPQSEKRWWRRASRFL